MSAGNRLKEVRSSSGLTQTQFGERFGLKHTQIRDIESGKQQVSIELAQRIENIFYIDPWWLLTGKGEMLNKQSNTTNLPATNNDGYEIDILSVRAGAGEGIYNYQIEVVDRIVLDRVFFKTVPDIKKIKVIQVDGDSMTPTLQTGDYVIIDETKNYGADGIYAIQLYGQILIKRLKFKLDGTIDIISDNKSYDRETYDPNQTQIPLHIIGMKTLSIQR